MLDGLRLPVYGADDGAALRDILFTWWEQKFLGAAESGAPAIGTLDGEGLGRSSSSYPFLRWAKSGPSECSSG